MKAITRGWMSTKTLERYSHTRSQAKRDAVSNCQREVRSSLLYSQLPAVSLWGPHKNPDSRRLSAYKKGAAESATPLESIGRQGGARTHNPRLRRPVLYPVELLAHSFFIVTLKARHYPIPWTGCIGQAPSPPTQGSPLRPLSLDRMLPHTLLHR